MSRPKTTPLTRLAVLGLGLVWATPAFGQDPLVPVDDPPAEQPAERFDAPPPSDDGAPPPVQDLDGWLGDGATKEDPLAPKSPPAADTQAELTPAERRARGKKIDRNYDQALEIYDDLSLPDNELDSLDRRIANNERIITDYTKRIARAREERRTMQVELMNRGFYLRQQREQGQISPEVYEKQLAHEERVSDSRDKALKGDLTAWTQTVEQARTRLTALRNERQMLARTLPRNHRRGKAKAKPKPRPGQRLMSALEMRLQKLGHFRPRNTLDLADPRSTAFSGMNRPARATDSDDEDDEDLEENDG